MLQGARVSTYLSITTFMVRDLRRNGEEPVDDTSAQRDQEGVGVREAT